MISNWDMYVQSYSRLQGIHGPRIVGYTLFRSKGSRNPRGIIIFEVLRQSVEVLSGGRKFSNDKFLMALSSLVSKARSSKQKKVAKESSELEYNKEPHGSIKKA